MKIITVTTDASFDKDTCAGGFAFAIACDKFRIRYYGAFDSKSPRTNVEAEVMCIGNAVHVLLQKLQASKISKVKVVLINTDCIAAMNAIKLQRTDTTKAISSTLKEIKRITGAKTLFKHVKAHTQVDDKRSHVNRWCDEKAKQQMRKQRCKLSTQA